MFEEIFKANKTFGVHYKKVLQEAVLTRHVELTPLVKQQIYTKFVNFFNSTETCVVKKYKLLVEKRFSQWQTQDFHDARVYNVIIAELRRLKHPLLCEELQPSTRWYRYLVASGHRPFA